MASGLGAEELMGLDQLAMLAGLPYTILWDAMHAHHTMTEGPKAVFMALPQGIETYAEHTQQARSSAD